MFTNYFNSSSIGGIKMTKLLIVSPLLWKFLLLDFFMDASYIQEHKSLKKRFQIILRKLLFIVNIMNMIAFMMFFASFMFQKPFCLKHLISGILSILQVTVTLYRYINIILNRNEILQILQKFPALYSVEYQQKYRFACIIKNFMLYKLHSVVLFLAAYLGGLVITINFWITGNINEYQVLLFQNLILRSAVFIWMQLTFFTFLATILVTEVLQYALIASLAIDFKILAYKFENLKDEVAAKQKLLKTVLKKTLSSSAPSTLNWNKQMSSHTHFTMDDLKPLIDQHAELFKIHKNLKNILNIPFLMTFIQSSILLSFMAVRITYGGNDRGFFISGLIRNFRNIYFQCHYCQVLKDSSSSIAEAINRCGWENINDKAVKLALMMIIKRSQVPASFFVMNISEITLEQLTAIILSTYSYYTICLNLYDRK
ncbi:hypothetical protein ACKWTF_013252 [Chironomus riparius]